MNASFFDWARVAAPMRWTILILLAVLATASTSGHPGQSEDHIQHMQINKGSLEPGENVTYHVNFMTQPLEAGWILIVEGTVTAAADVSLTLNGTDVAQWRWTPGAVQADTLALPETAEYEITIANPGDAPLNYRFTYDQTCECTAKFVSMNGGAVFFNWYLEPGQRATIEYNLTYLDPSFNVIQEIDGLAIEATVARQVGPGGVWPGDFEVIGTHAEPGPFTMNIDPSEADRYIVYMRVTYDAADGHSVLVLPFMETASIVDKGSSSLPIISLAVGVAIIAAVAVVVRMRRE